MIYKKTFFYFSFRSFSATLSFALLAARFFSTSSGPGVTGRCVRTLRIGFLPQEQTGNRGGQIHPFAARTNACFTNLSSSEWNVMTASLPPGFRQGTI
jgi:hypothetical protein